MDDTLYGKRDKRGDWKPFKFLEYPPVFVWPAQPLRFLRWFFGYPGYILPWNLGYALLSIVLWLYLTPSMAEMANFAPAWIGFLLVRNGAIVLAFYGVFHVRLYWRKKQGTSFKYNGKWPATDNSAFLFRNQTVDNMIWTLASGVPIWTAYEVLTLWAFANGYIPKVSFAEHPVYCVVLLLLIPFFREVHFYLVHRLIHWPPLYRTVHKLHHNNVNPGPWSGLAMHPVEHLLYFSGVFIHWVVPSHPFHAIFHLQHLGLVPAQGHVGFDRIVFGEGASIDTHAYEHYLHHKYFECNYTDGAIPIDKWMGTFHDGSPEAQERLDKRLRARAARRAAQRAKRAEKHR